MKILIFLLVFLIIGGLIIIENNSFSLSNNEEISSFSTLYLKWFNQIYKNTQSITGQAIQMEWLFEKNK